MHFGNCCIQGVTDNPLGRGGGVHEWGAPGAPFFRQTRLNGPASRAAPIKTPLGDDTGMQKRENESRGELSRNGVKVVPRARSL